MTNPLPGVGSAASPFTLPEQGAGGAAHASPEAPFLDTLKSALDQIGSMQSEADAKVTQLLNGNGQDVHSAMIAVEKANLSFQMMVQVRNKIVQAYQQISAMPF
ncbi:MAG TPA: flagellar hook-basal body complex protein FliE [Dongiaceae bacterium]|nr:flagellar hook-basal body complex protein FliE [Dongiaceae bacterium]